MKTKNNVTRIGAILMIAIMALGMVACGSKSVEGTYKVNLDTEELSGNLSHNGYLITQEATEENTLVLNKDNTYSYTKLVTTGKGITLQYVFSGTYSNEDAVVTLAEPADCEFSEDWAGLTEYGFLNSEGKVSEGAIVQCKADESHNPLEMFTTPYLIDSKTVGTVVITVDPENGTFSYNAVASSDDE